MLITLINVLTVTLTDRFCNSITYLWTGYSRVEHAYAMTWQLQIYTIFLMHVYKGFLNKLGKIKLTSGTGQDFTPKNKNGVWAPLI